MRVNKKKDRFFFKLVKSGAIEVYKDGRIYNPKTGKWIGSKPIRNRKTGERTGYRSIGWYWPEEDRIANMPVHRLVWFKFKGKIPDGYEPNHKNGIKYDNRLSNLELLTHNDNVSHGFSVLGYQSHIGTYLGVDHGNSKFSARDVKKIRSMKGKKTIAEIASIYGVANTSIGRILRRETYTDRKLYG